MKYKSNQDATDYVTLFLTISLVFIIAVIAGAISVLIPTIVLWIALNFVFLFDCAIEGYLCAMLGNE